MSLLTDKNNALNITLMEKKRSPPTVEKHKPTILCLSEEWVEV